jgi:DNA-binding CsgD family transcriptional regulator
MSADSRATLRLSRPCTGLPELAERALQSAGGEHPTRTTVLVQGPGGTGKTLLLTELTRAYRSAGLSVVDPQSAPDPDTLTGELAVVADDAHRLTDAAAHRMRRLLDSPLVHLAVAFRPWPRPAPLVELIDGMGSERRMVVLEHLDREAVLAAAREAVGEAEASALADVVLEQTGGLPALVHPLLRALRDRGARIGPGRGTVLSAGQPARLAIPDEILDLVRSSLTMLGDDARAFLHAVSAGAPMDADVLGELLGVSPWEANGLITQGRASGLLLGSGEIVPLARWALLGMTPADVTRRTRQRLLGLLLDRGEQPLELARTLAADGVRNQRAAQLLERHADTALKADPTLAGQLLGEAAATGAPVTGLAARRAHAAALSGDFDAALQWADSVLTDESAPDRARAAGVAATVLAQRGLTVRSAELYRLAGPERAGSTALALLATGSPAEAAAVLEEGECSTARGVPTMLASSEWLIAEGVHQSLRTGPDAGADIAAALSTLTRAAALLEPVGRTALLLDTPAALAALVALHSGELGLAESVLQRALLAEVGGPPSRPRHLLLLAWVAMLQGRLSRAREQLAQARAAAGDPPEPRDDVFMRALEVGLARRSSDVPALVQAWIHAREAIVRYPIDLFTLLPLGELMIAGARLKDAQRLGPHVAEAQALLARLGDPQLWSTPLHWSGAQAAILADDPEALRPHAAALVAASRTSPYAATLARSGRCWLQVLSGDIDTAAVTSAAEQLAALGLAWDGSRLAGQAAARAVDPRARTALLSCARTLSEAYDETPEAEEDRGPDRTEVCTTLSGHLSEREREVARLVLDGQTYREIGGRLYISAKTVEHHVSRMRQRLGAGTRSDLLARLRAELDQGAAPRRAR